MKRSGNDAIRPALRSPANSCQERTSVRQTRSSRCGGRAHGPAHGDGTRAVGETGWCLPWGERPRLRYPAVARPRLQRADSFLAMVKSSFIPRYFRMRSVVEQSTRLLGGCARHHDGDDQQREERLDHRQNLGPLTHNRGVRGAEGGALIEGEEQIVREVRGPAGSTVLVLGELEILALVSIASASSWSTLVDLPVLHGEHDHVRTPKQARVPQGRQGRYRLGGQDYDQEEHAGTHRDRGEADERQTAGGTDGGGLLVGRTGSARSAPPRVRGAEKRAQLSDRP